MANNDLDAWLNLLSDEERAGVMKVQIVEAETTKRAAIEEEGKTRRAMIGSDGYHIARVICSCGLVTAVVGLIGIGCQGVEVWGRTMGKAAPVTSASAAPALK